MVEPRQNDDRRDKQRSGSARSHTNRSDGDGVPRKEGPEEQGKKRSCEDIQLSNDLRWYRMGFLPGYKHAEFQYQEVEMYNTKLLYKILRARGFPLGYRVLCHNCNLARGFYGYCPHS